MPVFVPSVSYKSAAGHLGHRSTAWIGAILLAVMVAGCSGHSSQDSGTIAWSKPGTNAPAGAPAPSGPPLNWQTSLSGDVLTIEIRDANDHYRVERVELIGPNGMTIAASEIDRETYRGSGNSYGSYSGGPTVGVGIGSWGGGRRGGTSVGVGLGFPLGGGTVNNPPPQPAGTVTRARLNIPDSQLYRQTVANWIIRVTTTDHAGQTNAAMIPAPKPSS